jgi:hypothetical protein
MRYVLRPGWQIRSPEFLPAEREHGDDGNPERDGNVPENAGIDRDDNQRRFEHQEDEARSKESVLAH